MARVEAEAVKDQYDLILIGSGFGSLFFLHGFLHRRPRARVLVLEWGSFRDAEWQRANGKNSDIDSFSTFVSRPGDKPWNYTIGFGGGTNCWWAQTPRLSPTDMRLKSTYGVGDDWPLSYDEIEPYYVNAEAIMQVAGPDDLARVYPMSRRYPHRPLPMTGADKILKQAMPDLHFAAPCARLTRPQGSRSACCATIRCDLCPVDAKFSALNSLMHLFERDNVDLCCDARVRYIETNANVATGVVFENGGRQYPVSGEIIGLGANGIQSPFILLQSGFEHPALGRYLHEKRLACAEVFLDGLDHFDGGTSITGMNLSLLVGADRSEAAGALIYISNFWRYGFRPEFGRWRQTLSVELMVEDLPQLENGVFDEGGEYPTIRHASRSSYCDRGADRAFEKLPEIFASLPVEQIVRRDDIPTGSHVQGTCRMGDDPTTSVVDPGLVHHRVRNLLILGTSVMPSCGPVNPSLTAAAVALRAAARL